MVARVPLDLVGWWRPALEAAPHLSEDTRALVLELSFHDRTLQGAEETTQNIELRAIDIHQIPLAVAILRHRGESE